MKKNIWTSLVLITFFISGCASMDAPLDTKMKDVSDKGMVIMSVSQTWLGSTYSSKPGLRFNWRVDGSSIGAGY